MLDDQSVLEEVRFVENNPIRWGIAVRGEDYTWSSTWSHALGIDGRGLSNGLSLQGSDRRWRAYLAVTKDVSL